MPSPTDRTWPTSRDLGFVSEIGDLVLQDRRNFSGADIHQPTSFMRVRIELSLVFERAIDHARPELDDEAADDRWIDLDGDFDGRTARNLGERRFERAEMSIRKRFGDGDLGPHDTLERVVQPVEAGNHVADGEQPAFGGNELDEIGGEPADFPLAPGSPSVPSPALRRRRRGS